MRRIALTLALIGIAGSAAYAQQTPRVDRIEIIEAAIYRFTTGPRTGNRPTDAPDVRAVEFSTVVPAQVGVQFGFKYLVVGEPAGAPVLLNLITRIPAPGIRRPGSGVVTTGTQETVDARLGEAIISGYSFDEQWELVPGAWVFELWSGNRKLAEQRFDVVGRR
jgi:hypothetical protein